MDKDAEMQRLRDELHWALSWFNAKARVGLAADRYATAVRLTGKPDPQAWRDGVLK